MFKSCSAKTSYIFLKHYHRILLQIEILAKDYLNPVLQVVQMLLRLAVKGIHICCGTPWLIERQF